MKFHFIIISILITLTLQQQQDECLFINCKCDADETTSSYEIICKMKSKFPQRDPNQPSANMITLLEINKNDLESIPDNQFNDLDIDFVDLSSNKLTQLNANIFNGIKRIETLDLSNNTIDFIDQDTFTPLTYSLVQLNLGRNKLGLRTTFDSTFTKLKNLTMLDLAHNELKLMPNLSQMTKLTLLTLSSNFIKSLVDTNTKESLLPHGLIELNLNENRLTHLTEDYFVNLKDLKYLSLESNQINSIGDYAFSNTLMLSSLSLCKNYLNQIPSKALFSLNHLQRLDLSSQNQILRQIDNYAFDRQSSQYAIRRIDLSNNRIAKIEDKAFCSKNKTAPFINVKELDLAANPLSSLNSCLARQLSNGLKDPQQSRVKIAFKVNQANQLVTDNLKCDCEITKSAQLVDFEGDCKNEDGNLVPLKQFKCNQLDDVDLDTVCSMSSYNCVQDIKEESKSYSTQSNAAKFSDNFNNNNKNEQIKQPKIIQENQMQATKMPASAIVANKSIKQQINSNLLLIALFLFVSSSTSF